MKPDWLDLKLSLGNIITIGTLIVALVSGWYSFDNRLSLEAVHRATMQLAFDELRGRVTSMERERNDLAARVIRIEEKLSAQNDMLARILRTVERENWRDGQQ